LDAETYDPTITAQRMAQSLSTDCAKMPKLFARSFVEFRVRNFAGSFAQYDPEYPIKARRLALRKNFFTFKGHVKDKY